MDALYILSPMGHIIDCLMADFERKRYRKARLLWTACQCYTRLFSMQSSPVILTLSCSSRSSAARSIGAF